MAYLARTPAAHPTVVGTSMIMWGRPRSIGAAFWRQSAGLTGSPFAVPSCCTATNRVDRSPIINEDGSALRQRMRPRCQRASQSFWWGRLRSTLAGPFSICDTRCRYPAFRSHTARWSRLPILSHAKCRNQFPDKSLGISVCCGCDPVCRLALCRKDPAPPVAGSFWRASTPIDYGFWPSANWQLERLPVEQSHSVTVRQHIE